MSENKTITSVYEHNACFVNSPLLPIKLFFAY